ncbi:hypothetical protein Hanom_Chr04g00350321 [Helianthus anomalus]
MIFHKNLLLRSPPHCTLVMLKTFKPRRLSSDLSPPAVVCLLSFSSLISLLRPSFASFSSSKAVESSLHQHLSLFLSLSLLHM